MADKTSPVITCKACDGEGYRHCGCWPADCICATGDETCDECGGEGVIDTNYDYDDTYYSNKGNQ